MLYSERYKDFFITLFFSKNVCIYKIIEQSLPCTRGVWDEEWQIQI